MDTYEDDDFDTFSSVAAEEEALQPPKRAGKRFSLENLYFYFASFIGIFVLSMVIFSRPFGKWLFGDILKTIPETSLTAEIIKSAVLTISFSCWKLFSE